MSSYNDWILLEDLWPYHNGTVGGAPPITTLLAFSIWWAVTMMEWVGRSCFLDFEWLLVGAPATFRKLTGKTLWSSTTTPNTNSTLQTTALISTQHIEYLYSTNLWWWIGLEWWWWGHFLLSTCFPFEIGLVFLDSQEAISNRGM